MELVHPLPARAHVDHGLEVIVTENRRNRAAGIGCHDAARHGKCGELLKFATWWMNYFGSSHTYRELLQLDTWMSRLVRLYY